MRFHPFILMLGLALGSSAEAGSIRLRTSAIVEPGAAVRVGDIATLEGEDVSQLSALVVIDDPMKRSPGRAWINVTVEELQRVLATSGVRMSALSLSGSECSVRFGALAEKPAEPPRVAPPRPTAEVVALTGPPTIRKHAAAALATMLEVDNTDLRLLFDAGDADFLDEPRFGVQVAVQPQTTTGSSRSVLACRVFDGDRLLENRTIRADVQVRRRVVVLQQAVRRKDEIPSSALREQEMWLAASAGRPIGTVEEVAGSLARTRLEPGSVLCAEHLETPIIVRRNELVSIHAMNGGFEVQMRARARADARRGDVIAFRPEGSKKDFTARVERPGVAVLSLDREDSRDSKE